MIHYKGEGRLVITMEEHFKWGLNSYRIDEFIKYCRKEISPGYISWTLNEIGSKLIKCGTLSINEYSGCDRNLEIIKFFDFYLLESWPTLYIIPKTLLGVWLFTNWWGEFIE